MKARTNISKGFKPIDFTITIESEEELRYIYAMFNCGEYNMIEFLKEKGCFKHSECDYSIPSDTIIKGKTFIWEDLSELL